MSMVLVFFVVLNFFGVCFKEGVRFCFRIVIIFGMGGLVFLKVRERKDGIENRSWKFYMMSN